MPFNNEDDFRDKLSRLWMKAEKTMKLAERIGDRVVEASVLELRYAGRREMQAHMLRLRCKEQKMTVAQDDEWQTHAIEACENCVKARDDAVDSAVMFMNREVEEAVNKLGHLKVAGDFVELPEFRKYVRAINELIVESRGDRTILDGNYDKIENDLLPKAIALHAKFKDNSNISTALQVADEQSREEFGEQQYRAGMRRKLRTAVLFYAIVVGAVGNMVYDVLKGLSFAIVKLFQ